MANATIQTDSIINDTIPPFRPTQVTSDAVFYVFGTLLLVGAIAGVVENATIIYGFLNEPSLKSCKSSIPIIALACINLAMSGLVLPPVSVANFYKRWIFGDTACGLYGSTATFLGMSSINIMVVTSCMDRYTAIMKPVFYASVSSIPIKIALAVGVFLGFMWAVLPLMGWNRYI